MRTRAAICSLSRARSTHFEVQGRRSQWAVWLSGQRKSVQLQAYDLMTSCALTGRIAPASHSPRNVQFLTGHQPRSPRRSPPPSVYKSFDLRLRSLRCLQFANAKKIRKAPGVFIGGQKRSAGQYVCRPLFNHLLWYRSLDQRKPTCETGDCMKTVSFFMSTWSVWLNWAVSKYFMALESMSCIGGGSALVASAS